MKLKQIGIIKNSTKTPVIAAGSNGLTLKSSFDNAMRKLHKTNQEITQIIINEDMVDILDGIEEYSHIVVLYWAHKVPAKSRSLTKVHPMGDKNIPLKGIFSTYSPIRPNPVLMTIVKLCKLHENIIEVTGMDAINGSPVIDIKPYVKKIFNRKNVSIPVWMKKLIKQAIASKVLH